MRVLPISLRCRSTKIAAATLVAAAVPAAALLASGVVGADPNPGGAGTGGYQLTTIFSGATLGVTQPDDVTAMDGQLFVGFQNGVGPQGQASSAGVTTSNVVEMTTSGVVEGNWQLTGHIDGLTADPGMHGLIATVNEDANSHLYTIDPQDPTPVEYTYSPTPLPHNGGTDAISIVGGQILVSASAPGTVGAPAPQPTYPAVYSVSLDAGSHTATVTSLFSDTATATAANAPTAGKPVTLGLTDPDSNAVVPPQSPRFAGDFVLDSQGDKQQIYVSDPGTPRQHLTVLGLSTSVDDTAWATSPNGALYVTDNADNLVDVLRGTFTPGTAFSSVTPCDANTAPSTCGSHYLANLDLTTGGLTPVDLGGLMVQPQGLLFMGTGQDAGHGYPGGNGQGGNGQGDGGQGQGQGGPGHGQTTGVDRWGQNGR